MKPTVCYSRGDSAPVLKMWADAAIQSADFADTDVSDEDLEREDVLDSDGDDFDSLAGFDSPAGLDDESLDDAVLPFVAGVAGDGAESESVLAGALFFA